MNKETGGPAFPFTPGSQPTLPDGTWDQNWDPGDSGMTLRDYFAALASEKDIEEQQIEEWEILRAGSGKCPNTLEPLSRSEARYRYADAMLIERNK